MGVNTVLDQALAFAIGAAFSGFAGSSRREALPGEPGELLASPSRSRSSSWSSSAAWATSAGSSWDRLIYSIIFLPSGAAPLAESWATSLGFWLAVPPDGDWPGIGQEVQRLKFLLFGLILVLTMLLRPQGLIPSRARQQELVTGVRDEPVIEDLEAEPADR